MSQFSRSVASGSFILLSLAHAHLVGTVLLGGGSEPRLVFLGHVLCLGLATGSAAACWNRRSWAWKLVGCYGVALASLILSLGPALQLPSETQASLRVGALAALSLFSAGAWLIRLSTRAPRA